VTVHITSAPEELAVVPSPVFDLERDREFVKFIIIVLYPSAKTGGSKPQMAETILRNRPFYKKKNWKKTGPCYIPEIWPFRRFHDRFEPSGPQMDPR
jgi:hypothetical protein